MTPQQISRQNERNRSKSLKFMTIDQEFGKIWLKQTKAATRKNCCDNGNQNLFEAVRMEPPSYTVAEKLNTYDLEFAEASNIYNNILAFGAVGVDNGKNIGFDQILGKHCCRISGRTYIKLHATNRTSGLKYFLYNASDIYIDNEGQGWAKRLDNNIATKILNDMKNDNWLSKELVRIGECEVGSTYPFACPLLLYPFQQATKTS